MHYLGTHAGQMVRNVHGRQAGQVAYSRKTFSQAGLPRQRTGPRRRQATASWAYLFRLFKYLSSSSSWSCLGSPSSFVFCIFYFLVFFATFDMVGIMTQLKSSTMSTNGEGGSIEASARRGRLKPSRSKPGGGRGDPPPKYGRSAQSGSCVVWSLKSLSSISTKAVVEFICRSVPMEG